MISLLVFNKGSDMHKTVLLSNQKNSYGGSYDFEQLPQVSLPLERMQYKLWLFITFPFSDSLGVSCITVR